MIEIDHLTKRYGDIIAVDDLSVTIADNHIYGFLGPNGAGKTTTLNMITGCLAADSGEVTIDGYNLLRAPREAKRQIGYLPEQPPLYDDMTPEEFLNFVGDAKGLRGEKRHAAVESAVQKTGLSEVRRRLIRNLSKGYRQRVGIAQAILGEPQTIILDEPTVGLDPLQVTEVRSLIQELGKTHTVIFSSHILSEVSALCDRILILSHGKLMAEDTPERLSARKPGIYRVVVTVRGELEKVMSVLHKIKGINPQLLSSEAGEIQVLLESSSDVRAHISQALATAHISLLGMSLETASLEDVFLELTRDDPHDSTEKGDR